MLRVMTSRQRNGSVPTSRIGALAMPALDREVDPCTPSSRRTGLLPRRIVPAIRGAPGGRQPAFPFAKVRKQMRNGLDGGDSILGFFRVISEFLKMRHQKE